MKRAPSTDLAVVQLVSRLTAGFPVRWFRIVWLFMAWSAPRVLLALGLRRCSQMSSRSGRSGYQALPTVKRTRLVRPAHQHAGRPVLGTPHLIANASP